MLSEIAEDVEYWCPYPSGPPKKKKIACTYRAEWSRFHHMRPCNKGATYVHCTLCKTDICIAGGGQHEVDRHCKTGEHKELLDLCQLKYQPKVTTALAKAASTKTVQDQVVAGELYFAKFIAEHNLAFLAADHFTSLVKIMFPNSKIAEVYSSARTKTTTIIAHALAPNFREAVDYCSTVWDPPHRVHQVALERVQSFAARIVTRRWRQDAGPLKAHLKWPSLASRRKVQKLCVCRRILLGDSLIPSSTFIRASTVTRHHLNNQPLFRPFVRTNHHMSSFFVDAVLQWNKVPDSVCSLSSNLAFKSHIKKLFY